VLERWPKVFFVCPGMAGQAEAIDWVRRFKLGGYVRLLPFLPQVQLWDLFTRTNILVSVSAHDGTPNSFLEGIACGCFPIVGDIESLREWVTPGVNGFLVEPGNAQSLAEAILNVLNSPGLQASAAGINQELIQKRAEIGVVRAKIAEFYERILG
jgi:glycosyltransferase involved in cell wall biosynthesis